MNRFSIAFIGGALALSAGLAFAETRMSDGTGTHGHDMHAGGQGSDAGHSLGEPAAIDAATRTIDVSMIETDDGRMLFEPGLIEVQPGETVRFAISNDGMIEHEFIFNTTAEIMAHKDDMMSEAAHDMPHDTDNAITLQPGESGELAWTFASAGEFRFACLIPGHYEAGMFGPLVVTAPST
ncbi:cupredoxin domain-containing protein [Roseicitreum antarcticum]|jgi:uncharacterized cupredoxin-like copper-binding protein|uniref:Uncharacterized copper-binding protein, cupredoxin-like subfamily n=1 Tax=Roseicitreum antarcticum TaxID=564137 RepID=A0A1H3DVP2_9RHOB|nr:cupredoxin family protein [Roseicitreum antarcticum]SDX70178.1 Uncharacterized copper-binding protein, cupredoxin-like subfamily [Roseicitreum antarcticum]